MKKRFDAVSMRGRIAYVIMCVEAFLVNEYPDRDWTVVSEKMWKATSENWEDWSEEYCAIIPDVFLQYVKFDKSELGSSISESEFAMLTKLYDGITEGKEDDPSDEINYMLNKPFEMAMIYEGTVIGDGMESVQIIENAERILIKNGILLPDYTRVRFSSSDELNGWGNGFDGKVLSIVKN